MHCHLGFFFELSAARSFLCPLSMKCTLASGKQALPSISALEIKRRISFFRSESELSAFPSFNFPCLRESGTTVLSDIPLLTAAEQGSAQRAPSLDVPLCRRQTGNGLSLAPAARNVRAAVCFLGAVASARQAHPPRRRGVPFPALLPVGFVGGLPSAGLSGGGETILFQNYHNKSTRICQ